MNWAVDGQRLPRVATTLLLATGGLAVVAGVAIYTRSLPPGVGATLPANYRVVLAVLAVTGGIAHLLAGVWARNRRPLFRIVASMLVGTVLLQVSLPVDALVVVMLALGRAEFEDGD